jgi:hypothetical protein
MLVERMNDREFAMEIIRDYVGEMLAYALRALVKKGNQKKTWQQLHIQNSLPVRHSERRRCVDLRE